MDFQQEGWDAISLAATRALIAGTALLIPMFLFEKKRLTMRETSYASLIGIFGYGTASILFIFGIGMSDAVTAAIIATMVPVVSALMDLFSSRQRLPRRLAFAVLFSVGGGLVASLDPVQMTIQFGLGELLVFASVVFWVLYTRMTIHYLYDSPQLGAYSVSMLTAGSCLLLAGLIASGFGIALSQDFSTGSLAAVVFLGVFSTGISIILWFYGSKQLGVTTAALHQNLVPVFVMLIMFAMGEGFDWQKAVGGTLVVAGAILAQLRTTEERH